MDPEDGIPTVEAELRDLHGQLAVGLAVDSPTDERTKPYWDSTFGTANDPFVQLIDDVLDEQRGEIYSATRGEHYKGPWSWRKRPVKAE